jgi:predicted small lipoprotein YifL
MKKYLLLVLAALLIMDALAGCGEQGNTPVTDIPVSAKDTLPSDSTFTNGEHEKLLSLRFEGYEKMTVAEFRDKVGAATDTKEYTDLFAQLPKDTALQELKDTDEDAEFLFYILPLAGDDWKTRSYSGEVTSSYTGDKARLEYSFTLTILNPDMLLVKDYNDTRLCVMSVMQDTLRNKTKDELRDETAIRADVQFLIDHLLQNINQTAELSAAIEFAYFPLPAAGEKQQVSGANEKGNPESRRVGYGTKEDYQSLLALKTSNYASMSVADFNTKLLAWANEDVSRMERVDADTLCNDFQVNLSEEELAFIRLTVFLSGTENGEFVQSNYTSDTVADPIYQESLPQKVDKSNEKAPMWCDFGYRFSYHIANQETLTVGERDRCIGGMIKAVEKFWNDTTPNDLLTMTKSDMISYLNSLAAEYSTDNIVITISAEQVHFDHTEERPELP